MVEQTNCGGEWVRREDVIELIKSKHRYGPDVCNEIISDDEHGIYIYRDDLIAQLTPQE